MALLGPACIVSNKVINSLLVRLDVVKAFINEVTLLSQDIEDKPSDEKLVKCRFVFSATALLLC